MQNNLITLHMAIFSLAKFLHHMKIMFILEYTIQTLGQRKCNHYFNFKCLGCKGSVPSVIRKYIL